MPRIGKLIPEADIARMEEKDAQRRDAFGRDHTYTNREIREHFDERDRQREKRQAPFLAAFSECRSIMLARKISGVSSDTYAVWRFGDAAFCRRMNEVYMLQIDELRLAVVARAAGFARGDGDAVEGVDVDAAGTPIRTGASDAMAKMLLDDADEKAEGAADVIVNITSK